MNLSKLSKTEHQLTLEVIGLYKQTQSNENLSKLHQISEGFRQIHLQYADSANRNLEALKRGLFIQWIYMIEPFYLTGISDLDKKAEIKIIEVLNAKIEDNEMDSELLYMLTHYLAFDWAFEKFKGYKGLTNLSRNRIENLSSNMIVKKDLSKRGIMGKYWESITRGECNK